MRRALILLCVLPFAGCGDAVTDRETVDADTNAITAAAERTLEQSSARIAVKGTSKSGGDELGFTATGTVDFDGGTENLTLPGLGSSSLVGLDDTTGLVHALHDAGAVRPDGTETIDGRRTIHYTGTIGMQPVEVWVDDSGVIRRQRSTFDLDATDERPAQTVTVTIDFEEFGV